MVLWAPFVGQIRGWIRSTFPGHFTAIIAGIIAIAIGAAVVAAALRIRDRRAVRYAAIVSALLLGAGYAVAVRSGYADVDVVERFHFVEYGFVTLLFFRAWRPLGDLSILLLPTLAGLIVGAVDELFQWFIPVRVGELHDIFLNGAAIGCGLLFSLGLDPPASIEPSIRRDSFPRLASMTAAFVLALAGFVAAVHLGYEVHDAETGTFRSRYTAATLLDLARDRAARWGGRMIPDQPALSREDQYVSEALWHVRRRNLRADSGDMPGAFGENLILEKFFAPVLDTPSSLSPTGLRWSPEQRADIAARAAADPRAAVAYVSDAEPAPIYTWPAGIFWGLTGLAVMAILAGGAICARRET